MPLTFSAERDWSREELETIIQQLSTKLDAAWRFVNPWTVEILNQKDNQWSEFCHDSPLTLADAEKREGDLKAENPDAKFRVVPWFNSAQRQVIQQEIEAHKRTQAALEDVRKTLWLGHGHDGLYGDDGEMQCNLGGCMLDFKRESIDKIVRSVLEQLRKSQADLYQRNISILGIMEELRKSQEVSAALLAALKDLIATFDSDAGGMEDVRAVIALAERPEALAKDRRRGHSGGGG